MTRSRKQAPTETKHLSKSELYRLWYKNMKCSSQTIEKYMDEIYYGLVATIYGELLKYGQVKLPDIGVFYRSEQGGYEIEHPSLQNPDMTVTDYIPVKNVIRFRSSKNLKRVINHEPLKASKKRKASSAKRKKSKMDEIYEGNFSEKAEQKMLEDIDTIFKMKKESGGTVGKLLRENKGKFSFGSDVTLDYLDSEENVDEFVYDEEDY